MKVEIAPFEKLFNLAEARSLLPLVQSVTEKHRAELTPIQERLSKMLSNDPRRNPIEREYEAVVSMWKAKIEKLGAIVRGLWVVEFNVGEGVLSWRYPELSLNYFRANGDDFASRVKLADYIEEYDPDWSH
ncbi:MAG: DUF2203 domain-containing protein [Acidiferrobacterales bacterium]|nr:DUF2203 domain-containing protein [Acidiferrobacterales bacterium]